MWGAAEEWQGVSLFLPSVRRRGQTYGVHCTGERSSALRICVSPVQTYGVHHTGEGSPRRVNLCVSKFPCSRSVYPHPLLLR